MARLSSQSIAQRPCSPCRGRPGLLCEQKQASDTVDEVTVMWPDRRLIDLFGIEHPIVLAPMAGAMDAELAAAASAAGGLGSLPCAMLTPAALRDQFAKVRARTDKPVNVNFFCHNPPALNNAREARWRDRLAPYYRELGIDPAAPGPSSNRAPFDAAFCDVIEELRPHRCTLHFGLPGADLLPPAGVEIGPAFLRFPEAKISAAHRAALASASADSTVVTNLMTGRPARGIINRLIREVGPINEVAPEFPLAAGALAPLRAKAEAAGSGDFSPLWCGQAVALGRDLPAREVTKALAAEARALLRRRAAA